MKSNLKKEPQKGIREGIIVGVVNNLIFGVILLGLTFLLNGIIEHSKIKNSLKYELYKIQAQKIGETWEALNIFDAKVDHFLQRYRYLKLNVRYPSPDDISTEYGSIAALQRLTDSTYYVTQKYRFWLGKDQYNLMGEFVNLIAEKQQIYFQSKVDSIAIIDNLINQKREQLDSVIKKMLK
jgi:hypothetical protein